jgi:DnaJ-class molecular chaperone
MQRAGRVIIANKAPRDRAGWRLVRRECRLCDGSGLAATMQDNRLHLICEGCNGRGYDKVWRPALRG